MLGDSSQYHDNCDIKTYAHRVNGQASSLVGEQVAIARFPKDRGNRHELHCIAIVDTIPWDATQTGIDPPWIRVVEKTQDHRPMEI